MRPGADGLVSGLAEAALTERAKGMLMVRLRVDVDTAHGVLRRVARERGCGVGELADAVVAGTAAITLPLPPVPGWSDATCTR